MAGAEGPFVLPFEPLLERASRHSRRVATAPTDAALIIYTSGTTGPPKGALMPHSCLIGNLPGFIYSHDGYPQPGDVFWSPADWAWTGGLMDALLPTLCFGQPIVGFRGRFDPERALRLIERYQVRNTFLFPTALKMMMKAFPEPRRAFDVNLRSLMSAGESVGTTVFEWTRAALGVTVNEMFGQTEMNYIVGNSQANWPAKPGSMGRPYPGHRIAVIDDDGNALPPGEPGDVAMHRIAPDGTPDPVFFLGYHNNPEGTRRKFTGDWCRTGDVATMDDDGYLWYQGRADDVFKVGELPHRPLGDRELPRAPSGGRQRRGRAGARRDARQRREGLRRAGPRARGVGRPGGRAAGARPPHLAPYEVPKVVEFIAELPMTTTGKVQRRVLREREREQRKAGGRARPARAREARLKPRSPARAQPLEERAVRQHPRAAGTTVGRMSEPNWKANAMTSRCHARSPSATRPPGPRDRDVLEEVRDHAPRDERQHGDVADHEARAPARLARGEHQRREQRHPERVEQQVRRRR